MKSFQRKKNTEERFQEFFLMMCCQKLLKFEQCFQTLSWILETKLIFQEKWNIILWKRLTLRQGRNTRKISLVSAFYKLHFGPLLSKAPGSVPIRCSQRNLKRNSKTNRVFCQFVSSILSFRFSRRPLEFIFILNDI